ncbi:magnesium transporter [Candidatus Micrarchaeota archaeon]|jgi:magnesium transporter|nr:magnesium transporter [Candidatus Micrarchaeota archaeon]
MIKCKDKLTSKIPIFKKEDRIDKIKTEIYTNIHNYDTIEYIYIINKNKLLEGIISFKELLTADPSKQSSNIMKTNLIYVYENDPQETSVVKAINNKLKVIPVVNKNKTLLGAIKTRTLLEILHEEHMEDILKIAGIKKSNVLPTSTINNLKSRTPWIIFGLFWGILAALVITLFEDILETFIILTMYFPVMMNVSGSIGNQANIIFIKNDALDKISNIISYFLKEIKIGVIMAFVCAFILAIITYMLHCDLYLSIIISISLFFAALMGLITGISTPFVLKKLGKDPANGSGPLITAFLDLSSLGIYLIIATILLSLI